ncbi:GAF domain-containing protein [Streptomyces mirabilis]
MHRVDAAAVAVYLLAEDGTELRATMIAGGAPSLFTLPARMPLNSPCATARALASGTTALLNDPDPAPTQQQYARPYPYAALAAPVLAAGRRFGALAVLRLETRGDYRGADHAAVQDLAAELAEALAALAERGVPITPGPMPALVPTRFDADTSVDTPGWGVSGVPGPAGVSLMYPLRRLSGLLNQATTTGDIVTTTQGCIMSPLHADALVLASAGENRLWGLGYSGRSSGMARTVHGTPLTAPTPAAQAAQGRPCSSPQTTRRLPTPTGTRTRHGPRPSCLSSPAARPPTWLSRDTRTSSASAACRSPARATSRRRREPP